MSHARNKRRVTALIIIKEGAGNLNKDFKKFYIEEKERIDFIISKRKKRDGGVKMRIENIEVKIYNVDDLKKEENKEILEKAYNNRLENAEYVYYGEENEKSLYSFLELVGLDKKYINYSYDAYNSYISYSDFCDGIFDIEGVRLYKYLYNNLYNIIYDKKGNEIDSYDYMTGYYMDYILLDPIKNFFKKIRDISFENLINECLQAWASACQKDCEYYYSIENFLEESEANEIEFTEDGKAVR